MLVHPFDTENGIANKSGRGRDRPERSLSLRGSFRRSLHLHPQLLKRVFVDHITPRRYRVHFPGLHEGTRRRGGAPYRTNLP